MDDPDLANGAQIHAPESRAAVLRCEVVSGAISMVVRLAAVHRAERAMATGRAADPAG